MIPPIIGSFLYPFGKKPAINKTGFYPQYILGFTITWPAIPGWAAIHGHSQTFAETCGQCTPLCIMVFFWIIYLNTAYSYQDVVDDRKMGVNSLYSFAGDRVNYLLMALCVPVVVCMPIVLREFHSAWLWVMWGGVWCGTFVLDLIRFDPRRPETGGTLHVTNFKLGAYTILVCAAEVFLSAYWPR